MQDQGQYLEAASREFQRTVCAFERDWAYQLDVSQLLEGDAARYELVLHELSSIREACYNAYWRAILECEEAFLKSVRESLLGSEVDALRYVLQATRLSEYLIGASASGQRLVHAFFAAACLTRLFMIAQKVGLEGISVETLEKTLLPLSHYEFGPFIALRKWVSSSGFPPSSQLFSLLGLRTTMKILVSWCMAEAVTMSLDEKDVFGEQAAHNLIAIGCLAFMPKGGADFTGLASSLCDIAGCRPERNVKVDLYDIKNLKMHLTGFTKSAAAVFRLLARQHPRNFTQTLDELRHHAGFLSSIETGE